MFAADDEDGDFLSPTGGAKLASLFGLDQASSRGNESFQYTAPKQPKKSSSGSATPTPQKSTPPPGAPAVLLATAVQSYQYVNGQYVKQGKLGAAVLGNHTTKEYKILLYASQQKQVTAARIHPGFIFTVQPSNYCTFYDDGRQNWSLMFESEKVAVDFCKEVCVAKGNSAPSLEAVVVQDLVLGEGQQVEHGDSLEVAYTGWLLQNHTVGQMFDSNLNKEKLLRLKLGAGKVIKGWEQGMLGMRKSGRRLMVVPPGLAYGSQGVSGRVPPDSTLVFEAEIRRVKFSKDSTSDRVSHGSRDSAASSPVPSVDITGPDASVGLPPAVPPKQGDLPLRAKSNSLTEQMANPDSSKAKLISRMAKMGQPMLPFLAGAAPSQMDSSDSEMEDHGGTRVRESTNKPVQLSATPPTTAHVTSHPLPIAAPADDLPVVAMTTASPQAVMPGSAHAFQPYPYSQSSVVPSQFQRVAQMYSTQTVSYQSPSDVTSFLMTETRQHNTEVRLAVGKVADKVDQLASRMDDIQKKGGISMGLSNISMETSMIMNTIQRIIQENECLKKEVFEKSSRIEEQNRKIGELINQNQRYMEQSNLLMEQRNDTMKSTSEQNQARVLQAEQDKHALPLDLGGDQVRLTEELALSAARVSQLQLEAATAQQKMAELQGKLSATLQDSEKHCNRATSLENQIEELKEQTEKAITQYRAEKQKRRETEQKLRGAEEELQDLRAEKDGLERAQADRKRKWQAERHKCDEELEEVRRNSQQELDNLRAQLRRARTNTDQAAAEQLAQLQAEQEAEWQARSEQVLATFREQQSREQAELSEQREMLEQRLAQLQDKYSALKQLRESEGQRLLQEQEQSEELQALKEKHASLQERAAAIKQQLQARVEELQKQLDEQEETDAAAEVKRVMNGVFHSLRAQFDLQETYTGRAVLGVLVNTIKRVTLELLTPATKNKADEEEGEEEEEKIGEKAVQGQQRKEEEQQNGTPKVPQRCEEHVEDRVELQGEVVEEAQVKKEETTEQETVAGETLVPEEEEEEEVKHVFTGGETNLAENTDMLTSHTETKTEPESEVIQADKRVTEAVPTGPPTQPPPLPNVLHEITSLSGGVEMRNGPEPFFQNAAPTRPPPPPTEEEEDEMSLKGRPPPAPLFGDDDDDDDDNGDLDWLGGV